jgi:hypothetical protein
MNVLVNAGAYVENSQGDVYSFSAGVLGMLKYVNLFDVGMVLDFV